MISPVVDDPRVPISEPLMLRPSSWALQESVEREPGELPSTFLLETEHRVRNDFLEDPWKETCLFLVSIIVFVRICIIAVCVHVLVAINIIMARFFSSCLVYVGSACINM